ncbi:uncharacterized protein LOC114579316 [Dendrobium catenatum]|uniref:uncharacterized protein LOC114579316 n=1 Tax=Dendrobium catenatum TaxID=906689 RepID=UPI00109F37B6|nr:uncharacterized protein LOC114579316 [Dendrobium catenatum]
MPIICILLTVALHRKWQILQLDVSNAFLHGDLSEDIYMRQPIGFVDPKAPKSLGNISLFLGIQVVSQPTRLFLTQQHYAEQIIQESGLADCNPSPTPFPPKANRPSSPSEPFSEPTLYRRLAWSLQYLSITRPDIAFATNQICQHMHQPTVQDFQSLKRLLRYIKGTISFSLPLTTGELTLQTYTDVDWASDSSDRKSISGFYTFLGPNLVSWSVKKQVTVAKSSTEAEYRSLSAAT